MSPIGPIRPRPPAADEPFRHLIAQYTHRVQTVRCTCGFTGSSFSPDGGRTASEWDRHIRAARANPGVTSPLPG